MQVETPKIVMYSAVLLYWSSEPHLWGFLTDEAGSREVGGVRKNEHDSGFSLAVCSEPGEELTSESEWGMPRGGKKSKGSVEGGAYLLHIPCREGNVEALLIVFR